MARLRAVVISQPVGLAGSPSRGQRSAAIANASAAASSASSMSPRIPIRVASTRPHWSRKTASSATEVSVEDGPYLDRGAWPRLVEHFLGDGECSVEIVGLDQDQAGEILLAVDERSVGQQHPSLVVAQ